MLSSPEPEFQLSSVGEQEPIQRRQLELHQLRQTLPAAQVGLRPRPVPICTTLKGALPYLAGA